MAKKRIPALLFNVSEEDKKAYELVMASGMPCELLATEDDNTPVLISRAQEFRGLKEIKEYVEGWNKRYPSSSTRISHP